MHKDNPPDISSLVSLLKQHDVRYVITGSFAVKLYGVDLEPNDFDITPALDIENLNRLAKLLMELEAMPGAFGYWITKEDTERKWIQAETTQEMLDAWKHDPEDISTMDHLYSSKLGNFDVVPEVCGKYEQLISRAKAMSVFECEVKIAHVDDLLARLTVPRRDNDIDRVKQLREIQRTH